MKISWETFRFPLNDERWKSKALVGGVISLIAIIFWPLYLPLMGFGVRIMRRTIKGEEPSLPEWDNWGGLFSDGLRFGVVSFVYNLPTVVLFCCAYIFIFAAVIPFAGVAAAGDAQSSGFALLGMGGALIAYALWFVLFGIGMILSLVLTFLSIAAQTRWVASGELSDAFQFGEVWRLVRRGFSNYMLAFAIWYAAIFVISFIATLMIYTIVLACLYPFMLGIMTIYSMVMMATLFGMAYHHTQSDLAAADAAPPPA